METVNSSQIFLLFIPSFENDLQILSVATTAQSQHCVFHS